ncbi:MAG: hypoxanthine-guanine phosphoribosyltransferase [Methylococcaceae bacterium]|nr:hypoxanthine-guanine phosphoribosyltransferase [Methylococcaceae bacterium]
MNKLDEIRKVEREADRLYSEAEVEATIDRVAAEITARLGETNPIVLTVLNGGIIFAGKLLTRLHFPLEIDSICASRYRGETSGGEVHWLLKPRLPLPGRTVLIADDVLDEGVTLAAVIAWCQEQGAEAVYAAVLVDKQIGRKRPCRADFVGLEAENRYLFGYGMDYKNYLRNAPGIFACKGD